MAEEDIQRQIDDIREDIKGIKDNHLVHLQENIFDLKVCIGKIAADLRWIKTIGAFLIMQAIAVAIKLFIH